MTYENRTDPGGGSADWRLRAGRAWCTGGGDIDPLAGGWRGRRVDRVVQSIGPPSLQWQGPGDPCRPLRVTRRLIASAKLALPVSKANRRLCRSDNPSPARPRTAPEHSPRGQARPVPGGDHAPIGTGWAPSSRSSNSSRVASSGGGSGG